MLSGWSGEKSYTMLFNLNLIVSTIFPKSGSYVQLLLNCRQPREGFLPWNLIETRYIPSLKDVLYAAGVVVAKRRGLCDDGKRAEPASKSVELIILQNQSAHRKRFISAWQLLLLNHV
jgi:hypothetical protein